MMELLTWAIGKAWQVLCVVLAWMVFKYIVNHGTGAIHDLFETITMGVKALSMTLKRKFFERIKKEQELEGEGTVK